MPPRKSDASKAVANGEEGGSGTPAAKESQKAVEGINLEVSAHICFEHVSRLEGVVFLSVLSCYYLSLPRLFMFFKVEREAG